ncbi:TPA: hypothetical protein ACWOOY_003265 [Escherichia coli]|nr:hypothetical protein [Escherichia coli]EHR9706854.1 hypothetical protein [Escherichia coli]EHY3264223.1 hypothetical protein [Escherichia coli]EKV6320023.1 hypothetical protein [Escherichia coli]KDX82277.1 hypothetical protein AC99_5391 [Escherichia coli 2-222-05_S4_C2]KEO04334.1 hypothetical protein AD29_5376 [Escherichia coli 2-222-05_S4_C3]
MFVDKTENPANLCLIRAVTFAIKWMVVGIAVSPMLYGLAKLIVALKS